MLESHDLEMFSKNKTDQSMLIEIKMLKKRKQ